jgi:glycosyltransferase involved in cell wall biosynthesis
LRVLIVTPYLPHRRVGHGGGTAVRSLVHELARHHDVALVSLLRPGEDHLAADAAPPGVPVHPVPFLDRAARGSGRLGLLGGRLAAIPRALRHGHPFYVAKYASRALTRTTLAVAERWRPDVIQVEYLQLGRLLRELRRWRDQRPDSGPRLVLDSHELGSVPRRRRAAAAAGPRRWLLQAEARAWDRLARQASAWADATLCVTPGDRDRYAALGGQRLVRVPLGIDTRALQPRRDPADPPRALFLGSFDHPPNREAARLLCEEIWPAVRREEPTWELDLAGPGSDRFLADCADRPAGVRGLGFVDDLTGLFARSRLFVAPLFSGGGIKIKILEALARGIPTVTTPIGAEGIVTAADQLVAWAESPAACVQAVLRTGRAPEAAEARARRARQHVEAHYSWEAVVRRLEAVYRGELPGSGSSPAGSQPS